MLLQHVQECNEALRGLLHVEPARRATLGRILLRGEVIAAALEFLQEQAAAVKPAAPAGEPTSAAPTCSGGAAAAAAGGGQRPPRKVLGTLLVCEEPGCAQMFGPELAAGIGRAKCPRCMGSRFAVLLQEVR